jgi:Na+/proline symporter
LSSVVYLTIAWRERRAAKTALGYFQAGRNIGASTLSGTYVATSLALANAIFYFLWLGYTAGLVGFWIQAAWCAGFVLLYFFLPKLLEESGTTTFHEFLAIRFGRTAGLLAALISTVGLTLNFGYEVLVGATISEAVWVGNHGASVAIAFLIAILVASMCWLGGFAGVLRTDATQWILATISLIVALVFTRQAIETSHGLAAFHAQNADAFSLFSLKGIAAMGGGLALLSNIAFSLPWQFCDMTSWQKLSASDPNRRRGIGSGILFSGLYLLFIPGLVALTIGIYLRGIPGSENSLFSALFSVFDQQPVLLGTVFVGFLAAQISTAETFLIGATQAIALDVLKRDADSISEPESDSSPHIRYGDRDVWRAKLLLLPIAIAAILFCWAYWARNDYSNDALFSIVYPVYSAQLSLACAVFAAIIHTKSEKLSQIAGVSSICVGFATTVAFGALALILANPIYSSAMPIATLFASTLTYLIATCFRRN